MPWPFVELKEKERNRIEGVHSIKHCGVISRKAAEWGNTLKLPTCYPSCKKLIKCLTKTTDNCHVNSSAMLITATLVVSITTAILIGAGSAGTWSIWWSTHRNPPSLASEVSKLTDRVKSIEDTLKRTKTAVPPEDGLATTQTNQETSQDNKNASDTKANDDEDDKVDISNARSNNSIPLAVRHQSAPESMISSAFPVHTHAE
ncbi:hypothetical protein TEQG_02854 [Trichophyton equinum CBS 127.97]|uniref:Uncharacterized protein n=1 Tax=Trichophyton equinum (strain ATCC MYA-4606 / CBS 127.97) TaxID=559882 RepID=F2PPK3_TRIEC|nr:hypothetical protein TEQG_02854 [Trichophyton equinum CBS 127.97]